MFYLFLILLMIILLAKTRSGIAFLVYDYVMTL